MNKYIRNEKTEEKINRFYSPFELHSVKKKSKASWSKYGLVDSQNCAYTISWNTLFPKPGQGLPAHTEENSRMLG